MTKKQTETNNYSSQYQDPRWQKKRLEILERDEFTCCNCGDSTSTLHVHHKLYEHGRKVWEYPDSHLITYCDECHESIHDVLDNFKWLSMDIKLIAPIEVLFVANNIMETIMFMNPRQIEEAFELVKGVE